MKNNVILAGKARNVRTNQYNGRDFVSFTASVADPTRKREDGSPFTYSIPVSTSGPQATRLKEKLKDNAYVCVEGHFEPVKRDDTLRYPVNATSVELMDAGSLNHVVIQGRLARDPELRTTNNGNGVCTVPVATTRSYADKNGEWHNITSFVTVIGWNDQAQALNSFQKGKMVWLVGKLTSRKWTDNDGKDHYPVELVLDTVYDGGTGKYNQSSTASKATSNAQPGKPADTVPDSYPDDGFPGFDDFDDEELPFN